jgi:very-short-patch-repair endonuclease
MVAGTTPREGAVPHTRSGDRHMSGMYGLPVMAGVVDRSDLWAVLQRDRVVRLEAGEAVLASPDLLLDHAPAVLTCHVGTGASVAAIVDGILDELETAALRMFPVWLPGADAISGRSSLEIAAVRILARKLAANSHHFGPFVAGLAQAAQAEVRPEPGLFARETRAVGLVRILADSYQRPYVALLVTAPQDSGARHQQLLVAACEWLADHGKAAVWITGDAIRDIDRLPTVVLPTSAERFSAPPPADRTRLQYPAFAGRPHPGSEAEQKLEVALAACDWAHGRQWNKPYRTSPLRPLIRVDLMWPDARCVVEVDGDDHRLREKYAADRSRDVRLQLDGFGVLRFTNEQVLDDVATVLVAIEQYVSSRRRDQEMARSAAMKGVAQ